MAGKGFSIKRLFINDEAPQAIEVPAGTAPATSASAPTSAVVSPSQGGILDKEILTQLVKTLEDNNIDGYDYFEFRTAIDNMKNVVPTESDRFKAAFAAVASLTSPDKLISTAQFYLEKLSEKKKEFDAYVEELNQTKVLAKENEAKRIKEVINEKQQQIAKLNEECNSLQQVSVQKFNDSIAERGKVETVKNNFNSTYSKVTSDITSDITKIKTYLTQGK